jgi:hypothetical protein
MAVLKILRKKSEILGKNGGGEIEIIDGNFGEKGEIGQILELRRSHSWANLDIQNNGTKEDELPSIDIHQMVETTTENEIEQKSDEEKMEENNKLEEEEIDVHFEFHKNHQTNELCAQKICAHSERAFAELATHESILSKTNCQNSEFTKQNDEEATQIVLDVANTTKQPIEMTIQMPLMVVAREITPKGEGNNERKWK